MMVTVELKPALSRCVSSALSAQTHALVQVVCSTNQFVGIEPAPNKPFLGTHGAAFRYVLDPSAAVPAEMLPAPDAGGTVTSLRVYDVSASGPPLELLVSF